MVNVPFMKRGDTIMDAGPWCRHCGLPARVKGDPELGEAVHAGTGRELGPDKHVCAPIDFQLPSMCEAAARGKVAALGFP